MSERFQVLLGNGPTLLCGFYYQTLATTRACSCCADNVTTPRMQLSRLTVDVFDCDGKLADAPAIEKAMNDGVVRCGASVRQTVCEQFNPHGITCVLILAESHLVVSTWPENRYASIDAALCNPDMDITLILQPLLNLLQPQRVEQQLASTLVGGVQEQNLKSQPA